MKFLTHTLFGIFLGLLIIKLNFFDSLSITNKIIFIITIMISSSLPDLDTEESKISRKTGIATSAISTIFGHRGILHSIFIPTILFFVLYSMNKEIAVAVLIGYSSHIIIDSITKEGTRPLLPITNYNVRGFIKTGGVAEFFVGLSLVVLILVLIMK